MRRLWSARWDRARFWIERLTLQKRLVIAYILVLLVPSIVISIYIFRGLTGDTIDELKKNTELSLQIEQIHIRNNIETMTRAAQISSADPQVNEYLSKPYEQSVEELLKIRDNELEAILQQQYNNPDIEDIIIYMNSPHTFEIGPIFVRENRIKSSPLYDTIMNAGKGRNVWAFSTMTKELFQRGSSELEDTNPRISLYQEMQYPDGVHVGIVQIDMRLTSFFPNTYNALQEDQSQMLVIDQEGNLYRNPSNRFWMQAGFEEAAIAEQFKLSVADASVPGSYTFNKNGHAYLGVYSPIRELNAHMLKIVSLDYVYEDINRTRNFILIANVILLAILTLLTNFLNSFILKKLHQLTATMKKVRQGDFRFDLNIRGGGGEVGELAYHFSKMLRKINELIADAVNKKASAKEAELAALRSQIDSHFMFNTLENIKMMAEIDGQVAVSDALTALGGMMRYNMRWTNEHVQLKDELTHIGNYVSIANIRFEDRIRLEIEVDDHMQNHEILKMTLQPIVENAIKHGLRKREMRIRIRAELDGDTTLITVTDDGVGMTEAQQRELNARIERGDTRSSASDGGNAEQSGGIGLANVHGRIGLHYGKSYGLTVTSVLGEYTCVTIRIPHNILSGRLIS
ncbi:sensor histidine kinase [Cohnella sp. GCM10027633]|uniref:sensor histidine kinase n=1 Tax=unclassified Cohnella TaxID=2636738 RepID=UPI003624D545